MRERSQREIEGSIKGGATTRAKFFPFDGKSVYMRLRVDKDAAEVLASIPATERSRFLTEAIFAEVQRRQKGAVA